MSATNDLCATGLEVLDGSTPWLAPELMPEKPGGFLYGIRFNNHPKHGNLSHPCGTEDELLQVLEQAGKHVDVVYLPDQDRGVPRLSLNRYHPWTRPALREMFFKTLKTRGLVAVGAIGGAMYLNSSSSFMLFLAGLIFGVIPVFDSLLQWLMFPKTKPVEDLKRSMIHSSVFYDWIDKSPTRKYLLWIMLAIIGVVYYGQMQNFVPFTDAGKVQPEAIRIGGEWWRMFTGTLMHGNFPHIIMNGMAMLYIGKFIHRLASPIMNLIVFVISAFVGAIASTLFSPAAGSVGASGGVVGMIGFLAYLVLVRRNSLPYDFRSFTIRNILLLVILGTVGVLFIDNAGHAGGLIGGLGCGAVYHFFHKGQWDVPNTPVKIGLGIICGAILLFGFGCCMDLFFFEGKNLVAHLPRITW